MSFNLVILEGNLTRDPELKYTPSQDAIVTIGIATNEKWTGKDGQKHEQVMYVDCVAFKKSGENINKYFHKGDPILIQGRLQLDQWTAQDGTKRSKHKVSISSWTFPLGKRDGAQGAAASRDKSPPADDDPEIPFS